MIMKLTASRAGLLAATVAGVVVLTGCEGEADTPDAPLDSAAQAADAGATDDERADDAETATHPADAGDQGDLPVDDADPAGGAGPDDDAVSYPATDSVLAPECPVVPGPPIEHSVVSADFVEVEDGFECTSVIDSRGDALFITREVEAQLDAAGYEQTSRAADDDSADAVNVMSYLIGGDELHITIQQNGPSGLLSHYVLVSPARGNG